MARPPRDLESVLLRPVPLELKDFDSGAIFGLANYGELGEQACKNKFKNDCELETEVTLTKYSLMEIYKRTVDEFPKL